MIERNVWTKSGSLGQLKAPKTPTTRTGTSSMKSLVKFRRKNGHCMVSRSYEQDKSLGRWVGKQRTFQNNSRLRRDRKECLDEIRFAWKPDPPGVKPDDKLWHQKYEKLVEFKRKKGHCLVPRMEDASLRNWVRIQRRRHRDSKLRLERKELLDTLNYDWKADTLAARSSTTTDVRRLVITSFHALERSCLSHSSFFCFTCVEFGFGSVQRSARRNGTSTRPRDYKQIRMFISRQKATK
jgi:hypothetical protein